MKYSVLLTCSFALTAAPAISATALPLLSSGQNVAAHVKATVTTRRFSIDYPDHWVVTQNSNDYVIIYNQPPPQVGGGEAPPYMIKTDISIVPISIIGDSDPDMQVSRIEEVTINGRTGVRTWDASEGWAFPNSISTSIAVNSREIAYITSFYNAENKAAEQAIIQMHNTFKLF